MRLQLFPLSSLPLVFAIAVVLSCATPALAEKPVWVPVAELLVVSVSQADPTRMSEVLTRCTALNMIMAGLSEDESPELYQHYVAEAQSMVQNAVLIGFRLEKEVTGVDADIPALSEAAMIEVKGHVGGYNDWLDDNMATGASLFSDDLMREMDSCRLASRMMAQL